MIIYQQNNVSPQCAQLLAQIALLSGHLGAAREGLVCLAAKNNSVGLQLQGVTASAASLPAGVKGLLVFGEDPVGQLQAAQAAGLPLGPELLASEQLLQQLEFLAVVDVLATASVQAADVALCGSSPASCVGSYLNCEGRLQATAQALEPAGGYHNWELVVELAALGDQALEWCCEEELGYELASQMPLFSAANLGRVAAPALDPAAYRLQAAPNAAMVCPLPTADALTRAFEQQLV
jgi:formate dehydrogenase major subunit